MNKFCFLLCALALAGCSSVSVLEEEEDAALVPQKAPEKLWVRLFEVPRDAEFDAARATARADEEPQSRIARLLAEGVLDKAEEWIAPGEILAPDAKAPAKGLLVEGKILRTRQGSRALRLGIGFGLGRTTLETTVRVYNLDRSAKKPWLRFETTGGSNMEPGLVGMLAPTPVAIPVAASLVSGAATAGAIGTKGISQDATRTGRVIAAAIHDRLAAQNVVERKARVKRAGKFATPVGEVPVGLPEMPEIE